MLNKEQLELLYLSATQSLREANIQYSDKHFNMLNSVLNESDHDVSKLLSVLEVLHAELSKHEPYKSEQEKESLYMFNTNYETFIAVMNNIEQRYKERGIGFEGFTKDERHFETFIFTVNHYRSLLDDEEVEQVYEEWLCDYLQDMILEGF